MVLSKVKFMHYNACLYLHRYTGINVYKQAAACLLLVTLSVNLKMAPKGVFVFRPCTGREVRYISDFSKQLPAARYVAILSCCFVLTLFTYGVVYLYIFVSR